MEMTFIPVNNKKKNLWIYMDLFITFDTHVKEMRKNYGNFYLFEQNERHPPPLPPSPPNKKV